MNRILATWSNWRVLVLTTSLATLSACGGGGSSGASGNTNPSATLVVTPSTVSVTADITQPAPTASVQVSVQSTSSGQFYIGGSVTHQGVSTVNSSPNGTFDSITLVFKSPTSLGVGTYTDTLTLKGCYDKACTQQVTNSPATVSITYVVTQPLPYLYSISPSSVTAGAPAFTLSVSGANFQSGSQILWNGSARSTTFVNSALLTALISAADVAVGGSANVQVATGTAQSTAVAFSIIPLAPLSLTQISPRHVNAASGTFYVSAIGNGFTMSSSVAWNGATLATTYVSTTLLRAQVTANLVANVGSASVTVVNPPAQGGTTGPQTVSIDAPTLDAIAYQMNPAHTGAVSFNNIALPLGSAWSVDLGGSPSYALIVGGKVFVTASINSNSQMWALNAATGATIWGPIALSGVVNAAYDAGRLFVVSGSTTSQVVAALDPSTGNSLWSATVPGGWFPEPPVAADGVVYTTNGGAVAAFDESNGAMLWSGAIGGTSGIVALTADGVYGSSPCTSTDLQPLVGTVLWTHNSGCSGGGGATPVVSGGVLYSPDSAASSSGTVFDAENGTVNGTYSASAIPAFTATTGFFLNNGTLQGLARTNNQVLWSFAGDGQLSSAPIVVSNYVFIGSASGNLYALDATMGTQVWTQNLGAAIPFSANYGGGIYTGLAAGDGLLVVPSGTKVTAYTLSTSP